jgi:hypothetical protein
VLVKADVAEKVNALRVEFPFIHQILKEATKFVTWVELEERLRPEDTLIQLLLKPAPQAFVSDLQGTADIARILVHCRIPKRENIHLTVTPSRVGYYYSAY